MWFIAITPLFETQITLPGWTRRLQHPFRPQGNGAAGNQSISAMAHPQLSGPLRLTVPMPQAGSDVSDLATAHSVAVRLMKRVMMFSSFADCAPEFRRWTVKVTDERRRPVFTVIFPTYFVPRGWKPVLVSGARALLQRLDAINAVEDMSRVRVPAPPRGISRRE